MHLPLPAGVLAAAALLAAPAAASAQAPSLTAPLAPCYGPGFDELRGGGTANIAKVGPLSFAGPAGSTWSVLVKSSADSVTSFGVIDFDAAGRAALPDGIPDNYPVGPGVPLTLAVQGQTSETQDEISLGTTKATALGVEVAIRPGSGPSVSVFRPQPVVVSGVPFAGKVLYGFVVSFKAPRRNNGGDAARRSRKVVRRVRLGRADACGHVRKRVVLLPKDATGNHQLYVNAGPRLDKARAVFARVS